jgi:hypothetical protein
MDSNKFLIGFMALLVAFLALPIVANKAKAKSPAAPGTTVTSAIAAPARAAGRFPELDVPPLLNEANLVGTQWAVEVQGYRAKLSIVAGGIGYITHPMAKALTGMDYFEGRWRVEGSHLYITANAAGREMNYDLRIAGDKLYNIIKRGKALDELKRF